MLAGGCLTVISDNLQHITTSSLRRRSAPVAWPNTVPDHGVDQPLGRQAVVLVLML